MPKRGLPYPRPGWRGVRQAASPRVPPSPGGGSGVAAFRRGFAAAFSPKRKRSVAWWRWASRPARLNTGAGRAGRDWRLVAVIIVAVEPSNQGKQADWHSEKYSCGLRHATEQRDPNNREHHAGQQKPGPPASADGAHHQRATRSAAARMSHGARLRPLRPHVHPVAWGHLASDDLSTLTCRRCCLLARSSTLAGRGRECSSC